MSAVQRVGISMVLFRPTENNLRHLQSLTATLDPDRYRIAVFVNSEVSVLPACITRFDADGRNIGLGAHNVTVAHLISQGCTALVTLDQDTPITAAHIEQLVGHLLTLPPKSVVGPRLIPTSTKCRHVRERSGSALIAKRTLSTSGMTLYASRWVALGGYRADLFIGELDKELCLRNIEDGGRNFEVQTVNVPHEVGQGRVGWGPVSIVKHHPNRYYYYVRNKTKLLREGTYHAHEFAQLVAYIVGILLTLPANASRKAVMHMVAKGIGDGLSKRGGPLC